MHEARTIVRAFLLSTALAGEPPDHLRDDTPLQSSGILDSLATASLAALLEERFGIAIDFEDTVVERFDTVDSIVRLVELKTVARVDP